MRKLVSLTAIILAAVVAHAQLAAAQPAGQQPPCNTIAMTDETSYDGIVYHTPMTLIACQDGMYLNYGQISGAHAGKSFLAANYNQITNQLQGMVADYDDGTSCGRISYQVSGSVLDGQFVNIQGQRPVRNVTNAANACIMTGGYQNIARQYAVAQPLLVSQPGQAPAQVIEPAPAAEE